MHTLTHLPNLWPPLTPLRGPGCPLRLLSGGIQMTAFHWLAPGSDLMISPRSMDRLYERFFGYRATTQEDGTPTYAPPADILETAAGYQPPPTVARVPQAGSGLT